MTRGVVAGPPSKICPNSNDMSDSIRTAFLDKHNVLRSALALGTITNGKTGKLCRRASKMPTLTYNCELEKTAYDRAKQCKRLDSAPPNGVSENNHTFTTRLDRTLENAAQAATQQWWSELSLLENGIEQIQNFYYTHLGINSFAKIASDLTTQVGCGVVLCESEKLISVVCHYKTALRNAVKLYTTGYPCKKCPGGGDNCYIGLCPVA
ncbi:SCP-like protein [Oesophagostomum dentatum]|uniref:SCP-like protein n=1 Tax=Oesophagostomum dentatum TaxID=61180 RepID=A0A0B1TC81_OESDE|nr:SCP-like protein [Oesophagostomum dentatum]